MKKSKLKKLKTWDELKKNRFKKNPQEAIAYLKALGTDGNPTLEILTANLFTLLTTTIRK